MLTVNIRISRNLLTPALKKIRQDINRLPKELHKKMVDLTPIDTGNAKKKTRLVNNKRIHAAYAYAKVLNKGRHMTARGARGSKQAPKGMTGPLRIWYRQRVRQLLRAAKRR
jgi:hypothetical protein